MSGLYVRSVCVVCVYMVCVHGECLCAVGVPVGGRCGGAYMTCVFVCVVCVWCMGMCGVCSCCDEAVR